LGVKIKKKGTLLVKCGEIFVASYPMGGGGKKGRGKIHAVPRLRVPNAFLKPAESEGGELGVLWGGKKGIFGRGESAQMF